MPLAELEAAKAAVLFTRGPIHLLIDNLPTVKGIRGGPSYKHQSSAYQWNIFWESVGDREFLVTKVRAHQTREDAEAAGVDPLHWEANQKADELAESAARRAQLPEEAVRAVLLQDKEATDVQEHLVAVALQVATQAPQLYGANTRQLRQAEAADRAKKRKQELQEAARTTTHSLNPKTGKCLNCFAGPTRETPRLAFLMSLCPSVPTLIHHSHKLRRCRGLWWCEVCGGIGSKTFKPKLSKESKPPSETGKLVIRRLQVGRKPYHVKVWLDAGDDPFLE